MNLKNLMKILSKIRVLVYLPRVVTAKSRRLNESAMDILAGNVAGKTLQAQRLRQSNHTLKTCSKRVVCSTDQRIGNASSVSGRP